MMLFGAVIYDYSHKNGSKERPLGTVVAETSCLLR